MVEFISRKNSKGCEVPANSHLIDPRDHEIGPRIQHSIKETFTKYPSSGLYNWQDKAVLEIPVRPDKLVHMKVGFHSLTSKHSGNGKPIRDCQTETESLKNRYQEKVRKRYLSGE
jgi:hypothetical protein